ncbi:MAG: adenosylhomocysteinase [Bacteroidales bacterium]|jgi:adenosylhomocysteinase|nr:adenosylhomocysteinase [Bacteroidales bacterium]MCI1784936.1 adenosylhomocysteinase [Bacteroidales bacterium]
MPSEIFDSSLWESGELKIEWVRRHMPLLEGLEKEFSAEKPFKDMKVALSVHLEAKTAHLCEVLAEGGADMYVTGSNPLSTQDDVAAALAHRGLNVFARYGADETEYKSSLRKVISIGPDIIIDDGGDLVNLIHSEYAELVPGVIGGCEETTTGILRLQTMDREKKLLFPMMSVNNAACKHFFDNRYGTGQSVWDGICRTTNLIVAGKNVVVAGYGWCGKGVSMRAKGLGANVIVTEIDPVKAMEAVMDGFRVMKMSEAASIGDIFVTVTGCRDVITVNDFMKMKEGAICCNAGHFDVEVSMSGLRKLAVSHHPARKNIEAYVLPDGKSIYILAEGRLVNLAAGDGHPAEIMDMSFAIQALCARYLAVNKDSIKRERGGMLKAVPEEIDKEVAGRELASWGVTIDVLSDDQRKYLFGD